MNVAYNSFGNQKHLQETYRGMNTAGVARLNSSRSLNTLTHPHVLYMD